MNLKNFIKRLELFEIEYILTKNNGISIKLGNIYLPIKIENNLISPIDNNLDEYTTNYKIFSEHQETTEIIYKQFLFSNPVISFNTYSNDGTEIIITLYNIKSEEIKSMCFDILNRDIPHGILKDLIKDRYLNI